MSSKTSPELSAGDAALLQLGVALGQSQTFSSVAGWCAAAQAETLRYVREQKLFKQYAPTWEQFCPEFLKISRVEVDRTIKLLEEFGATYFELSQLTRVSPETYRAIAPAIKDGTLHFNGEEIALRPENYRKVAGAVAELRRAVPAKPSKKAGRQLEMHERIAELERRGAALVAEFAEISRKEAGGENWLLFTAALDKTHKALGRIALENGLL
jgi:hypothetical protein